jgi:hypothetical protein
MKFGLGFDTIRGYFVGWIHEEDNEDSPASNNSEYSVLG